MNTVKIMQTIGLLLAISILAYGQKPTEPASGSFGMPGGLVQQLKTPARTAVASYLQDANATLNRLDELMLANDTKSFSKREQNTSEWAKLCEQQRSALGELKQTIQKNLSANADPNAFDNWFKTMETAWSSLEINGGFVLTHKETICVTFQQFRLAKLQAVEMLRKYYEYIASLDQNYGELNMALAATGVPDAKKAEFLQKARTSVYNAKLIAHWTEKNDKEIRNFWNKFLQDCKEWNDLGSQVDAIVGADSKKVAWKSRVMTIVADTIKLANEWLQTVSPVTERKLFASTTNLQAITIQELPQKFDYFLKKIEQLLKDRVLYKCPYCAYKGDESVEKSGKVVRCKRCQKEIRLPNK